MSRNMPWFRFYSEALNDRKIQRICRMVQQPKAVVVGTWTTFLCLANDSPERGKLMFADDMWLTEDEIQAETGLDPVTFGKIVKAFQKLEMLTVGAGFIITNWDDRQFSSDNSTERVRRYRARKRKEKAEKEAEQPVKRGETLQERSSIVIEAEADTEADTEAELDAAAAHLAFENGFGQTLTPVLAGKIEAAVDKHGPRWVIDAIDEGVEYNARSWRYVETVLERWSTEGRKPQNREGNGSGVDKEKLMSRVRAYTTGRVPWGELSQDEQRFLNLMAEEHGGKNSKPDELKNISQDNLVDIRFHQALKKMKVPA